MKQARQLNQLRIRYIVKFTDPEWRDHHHYKCLCKLTQDLNVYHFLNQCPKYEVLRKEWKAKIAEIESKYLEKDNINNIQYLLFPHLMHSKSEQKTLRTDKNDMNFYNIC